jgi:hypothetical protein
MISCIIENNHSIIYIYFNTSLAHSTEASRNQNHIKKHMNQIGFEFQSKENITQMYHMTFLVKDRITPLLEHRVVGRSEPAQDLEPLCALA